MCLSVYLFAETNLKNYLDDFKINGRKMMVIVPIAPYAIFYVKAATPKVVQEQNMLKMRLSVTKAPRSDYIRTIFNYTIEMYFKNNF